MSALRLFERLNDLDIPSSRKRKDSARLPESIFKHVEKLLNTKQGTVLSDEFYGMPEFSIGVGNQQTLNPDELAKTVLEKIHRYDKRVCEPRVEIMMNNTDNISIRFAIYFSVSNDQEKQEYSYAGAISANGHFKFDPLD